MKYYLTLLIAIVSTMLIGTSEVIAASTPFEVHYVSVYDGDTFDVLVDQLPAPLNKMRVRIRSIDAPERGSKAKCEAESAAAEKARAFLEQLLGSAKTVEIIDPKWDNYGGRIDGDVQVLYDGETHFLSDLLVTNGYARRYDGGQRQGWCQKQ
jgi:endonuclease YncB( thermonuclease family)